MDKDEKSISILVLSFVYTRPVTLGGCNTRGWYHKTCTVLYSPGP